MWAGKDQGWTDRCWVTVGTSVHLTPVRLCPIQPDCVLQAEPDAASELSFRAENKLGKGSPAGRQQGKECSTP